MIVLTKAVALWLRAFGKPVSHEKAQKHQHFGAKKIRATRLINPCYDPESSSCPRCNHQKTRPIILGAEIWTPELEGLGEYFFWIYLFWLTVPTLRPWAADSWSLRVGHTLFMIPAEN